MEIRSLTVSYKTSHELRTREVIVQQKIEGLDQKLCNGDPRISFYDPRNIEQICSSLFDLIKRNFLPFKVERLEVQSVLDREG